MSSVSISFFHPLRGAAIGDPAAAVAPRHPQIASPPREDGVQASGGPLPAQPLPVPPVEPPAAPDIRSQELALLTQSLSQLQGVLQRQQQLQQQETAKMQAVATELAAVVAGRLVRELVEADRLRIAALIDETREQLPVAQPATVHLHPRDLELLHEQAAVEPLPWDEGQLQLAADPDLPRGACRVEGSDRGVLNHWGYRLAEIHQAMLDTIHAE